MSWWPSSWLPPLPSIDFALPSGIQKRFISFILKQTLGRFLKPGQLDIQQVDSQIGSGFVQVRDVELDNNAINSLISDLPIQLHDGSVGKVTARVPWPNPLTSSVGLSLESLHLTFHLVPQKAYNAPQTSPSILAESVASVADTFIHEELSPPEEAELRESLHLDPGASPQPSNDHLPGGFDPFLPDSDDIRGDSDLAGVSIFATLLERLLSRFEFDALDTKITLVDPGHASFTVIIPSVRYSAEADREVNADMQGPGNEPKGPSVEGVVRSVIISGVTLTTRSLRPPSPAPFTPTASPISTKHPSIDRLPALPSPPGSPAPPSPYSDSSDLDDDTHLLMSQSIAVLPPRAISPSSSVASSLYQSAISEASTTRDNPERPFSKIPPSSVPLDIDNPPPKQAEDASPTHPVLEVLANEIEDETLVSFASEPIVIRLITPPPLKPAPRSEQSAGGRAQQSNDTSGNLPVDPPIPRDDTVRVEVTLGTIGVALHAYNILSLLDVAQGWSSHSSPPVRSNNGDPRVPSSSPSSILDNLQTTVDVRGIVLLLLPHKEISKPEDNDALSEFFRRPLVPPRCSYGYVRLQLEGIGASLSMKDVRPGTSRISRTPTSKRLLQSSFWISELSLFAFVSSGSSDLPSDLSASPILLTDPRLPSQYPVSPTHIHIRDPDLYSDLPLFGVEDWTHPSNRSSSAKLSLWRTKPSHGRPSSVVGSPARRNEELPSELLSSPSILSSPLKRPFPIGTSASPGKIGESVQRSHSRAIQVKITSDIFTKVSHENRTRSVSSTKVDVELVPLHVFVDLDLVLEKDASGNMSQAMAFIDEVSTPSISRAVVGDTKSQVEEEGTGSDEEDADTPPATPRAPNRHGLRRAEREREDERRRLERLVLEDLDLGFDYGHNTSHNTTSHSITRTRSKRRDLSSTLVTVNLPMIRLQIRVPPPPSRPQRSGAVVLDVHGIRLCPGEVPRQPEQTTIRFAEPLEGLLREPQLTRESAGKVLLSAEWHKMAIAYCPLNGNTAKAILSVGSISSSTSDPPEPDGINIQKVIGKNEHRTKPQVVVSQSEPSSGPTVATFAVDVEIPSVYVNLSKPQIDGLQLWADDVAQLLERAFSPPPIPEDSRNTSLIGSRFFAKRGRGSGAETGSTVSGERTDSRSQTVIKVTVTEAALRFLVPRESGPAICPFDVIAADIDMLLEVKPEGKDETVLTLGIMDVTVQDTPTSGPPLTFFALTNPRQLASTIRPLLKLRFTSLVVPGTTAKESRVKVTLCGTTLNIYPDFNWVSDLGRFVKAPPGAFESVVPSERTRVEVKLVDTSIRALAPKCPGAIAVYIEEVDFKTVIEGNLPETSFGLTIRTISLFLIDDLTSWADDPSTVIQPSKSDRNRGHALWKGLGYALLAELLNVDISFLRNDQQSPADSRVNIDQATVRVHLCADTATALATFISDLTSAFGDNKDDSIPAAPKKKGPTALTELYNSKRDLMASLDEHAFRRIPEVGAAPDMINDDLPSNPDYLDQSFSATAGLREITDDDLDDFGVEDNNPTTMEQPGVVSKHGGETIRMLQPTLHTVEHHFDALPPDANDEGLQFGNTVLRVRAKQCDATLLLYDGYDWSRTRRIIEEEAKNMRRKLAKIRQLVAEGQTPDPSVEETNTVLFNSVYLGLEHNVDELEPGALLSAIDEELNDDLETASQSSWQSLQPQPTSPGGKSGTKRSRKGRVSKRSKGPSIEFRLMNLSAEMDQYRDHPTVASRTLITVHNIEILDHIKSSTWRKFLTALWLDSKGNIRETGSNMARVELCKVYPAPGNPITEARLRAKILPLKLHVDQDALDFLKKFFSFKDPDAAPPATSDPADEIYFQQAEVFPVDLKLDYKPRRVDYRALREGRTIELMNFFHFDGAEMTLRHITLTGITGWARFFDLLNDLWTPDVKATQLVDVISGVSPIRSVVNVGSGVADLVLLPIAQYRKDGRVVRGLQKGTTAFIKSTAIEAIKLGARLATGTQVILEQAEDVLGGQFRDPITAEALQYGLGLNEGSEDLEDEDDLISRYADQPMNVKEGVKSAYKSLKRNFNSAAQTILAVPMEVYERSGNEGTVRAVVRAVPIAVLKPMIGASEAVSKTLLGLHNTLDPSVRLENEAKYKHR